MLVLRKSMTPRTNTLIKSLLTLAKASFPRQGFHAAIAELRFSRGANSFPPPASDPSQPWSLDSLPLTPPPPIAAALFTSR